MKPEAEVNVTGKKWSSHYLNSSLVGRVYLDTRLYFDWTLKHLSSLNTNSWVGGWKNVYFILLPRNSELLINLFRELTIFHSTYWVTFDFYCKISFTFSVYSKWLLSKAHFFSAKAFFRTLFVLSIDDWPRNRAVLCFKLNFDAKSVLICHVWMRAKSIVLKCTFMRINNSSEVNCKCRARRTQKSNCKA